ncbi:UTP--glucose-1-phosphate uridylyltransferase [Aphanothece hegewaldii CCALA 016]|uniref:UTP--glucose-1-phosphate uridylyltransferase n=1 Tax=Aphanothece hegewaldii CCALA 016 TaxID=2107694 RepID=A0A2T1LXT5_9CHRO|nr:sugar phosphate nucleotidyltransferase [Aphanothece hegewaldii]PSF37116.1 UTP--glucose-1-phosphate uridylyltransferase [Aphanothece hegewaldii CCALA 016]
MNQPLHKAVIPAAGFGTRLFPATKGIKKEFFPLIDQDGLAKPVILIIVEEVIKSGIQEIAIIIQTQDYSLFADFFKNPPPAKFYNKLSRESKKYSDYLQEIGEKITLIPQEQQEGYGHAVYCAKDWVKQEPFLLLLGDHVYRSNIDKSCVHQLVELYQQYQTNVIGLTIIPEDIIHKAGIITGNWLETYLLSITQLVEKPSIDYARDHLHIPNMKPDEFLAIFGMYILQPQIFDYLEDEIKNEQRLKGEFQLTTALDQLAKAQGMLGYLVQGQYFDIGMPLFYRQTMIDFKMGS